MKDRMKQILCSSLLLSLSIGILPTYASEVVTYESLSTRIEENNSIIQEITIALDSQVEDYEGMVEYFEQEQATADREMDDAEEDGDMLAYVDYAMSEAIYEGTIDAFNDVVENLNSPSTQRTKEYTIMQLTSATQMLMISCETIEGNLDYLKTMEQMYEKMYEIVTIQLQTGSATELDVSNTYNTMLMISNNRQSLEDSYNELKSNLLILLGYAADAQVIFAEIPRVDLAKLSERNLEEDIVKAIGNNSALITTRQNYNGGDTPYETELYLKSMEDSEMQIDSAMRALYHEVDQAYLAYETANIGYESALIAWESAQAKNQLGMLSESQFLQAQMQYLSETAAVESAELSLIQAIDTYFWARDGILNL